MSGLPVIRPQVRWAHWR